MLQIMQKRFKVCLGIDFEGLAPKQLDLFEGGF